ncbi:MAG: hypothetical protein ACYCTH_11255 [Cellulomonas sp.]
MCELVCRISPTGTSPVSCTPSRGALGHPPAPGTGLLDDAGGNGIAAPGAAAVDVRGGMNVGTLAPDVAVPVVAGRAPP